AYQQLAYDGGKPETAGLTGLLPSENTARVVSESCARCHGWDGQGRQGAFPMLAGQQAEYLYASLHAYAQGKRHSGTMEAVVVGLSADTLRELADYYARLPRAVAVQAEALDAAAVARGAAIAQQGIPAQHVPACVACHGSGTEPRNPVYPKLAGQPADYLELQLQLFQGQRRGGTAYAHLMRVPAAGLTAEQRRDVASYFSSLP
ncbi:MAG TPA: c-type cytochrome, partial [Blastocatellia bacterium]|nr:c-type cytochrome [Blastocatellia bacterium]